MIRRTIDNDGRWEPEPDVVVYRHVEGYMSVSFPASDADVNYHRVFIVADVQICTCAEYKFKDDCKHIARAQEILAVLSVA